MFCIFLPFFILFCEILITLLITKMLKQLNTLKRWKINLKFCQNYVNIFCFINFSWRKLNTKQKVKFYPVTSWYFWNNNELCFVKEKRQIVNEMNMNIRWQNNENLIDDRNVLIKQQYSFSFMDYLKKKSKTTDKKFLKINMCKF